MFRPECATIRGLVAACLSFGVLACSGAAPEAHDDFASYVDGDGERGPELTRDPGGEGFLTTEIAAEGAFDRVAFRYDAAGGTEVDVRVSPDGGRSWSDWSRAALTYRDGIAHNAHADFPEGGTHAQLRFRTARAEDVSFVSVELFVYDPEPTLDDVPSPEGSEIGTMEHGLAATGVAVLRSQWGARSTRCSGNHRPVRMTVHHTVTANRDSYSMPRRMRQIQAFHMDSRGWCDVGYHFLVGQDGRVYQGRIESLLGAHVGGANTGNMGISFIGTFTSTAPSQTQMAAGARILKAGSRAYGIALNRDRVKGHREFMSTSCPGGALFAKLGTLITMAKGGTTPPPTPPPPSKGVLKGYVYWGSDSRDASKRIGGARVKLNTGATVTTGADGLFTFSLAAGTYTATFEASGYVKESLTKRVTSGATVWASASLAKAVQAPGTVKGYVYWGLRPEDASANLGDTSKRVSNATVTFSPGNQTVRTDASGLFQASLAAGTYTVRAAATGYDAAQRAQPVTVTSGAVSWGSTMIIKPGPAPDTTPPVLRVDEPVDGDVVETQEVVVSGSVSDASAIASLTVNGTAAELDGEHFELAVALQPGANTLVVRALDAAGNAAEASVTVTRAPPPRSGVRGVVRDGSSEARPPIAGATVLVGEEGAAIATAADGSFELEMVPGLYAVSIVADGFAEHHSEAAIAEGEFAELDVVLERREEAADAQLVVTEPTSGAVLQAGEVRVAGTIARDVVTAVQVNGAPATIEDDGRFHATLELRAGSHDLVVVALADATELARASVTVLVEERAREAEGCGCAGTGGPALAALLPLLALATRRRARR